MEEKLSNFPQATSSSKLDDHNKNIDHDFEELFQTLPKQTNKSGLLLAQYQGFWFSKSVLQGTISFQNHFQAKDTDILLSSFPKSGTTWLKSLVFSIVNRDEYSVDKSPLLSSNPHKLVPFIELDVYQYGHIPHTIDDISCPRIFSTHLPNQCLPATILDSKCRIVYLCRNPLDIITSFAQFSQRNEFSSAKVMSMEDYFDSILEGIHSYGPLWDHVLGYWNASIENKLPQRVLFLKYEDLKMDTDSCLKKIADFLGYSFSAQEEKEGLVEKIAKLCSLESLKNLDCNKEGQMSIVYEMKNSSFFRKGEVGDWVNYLPPSKAEQLVDLMMEKFGESGLSLEIPGRSN